MPSTTTTTIIKALLAFPSLALASRGWVTTYQPGMGACGIVCTDAEMVAAIGAPLFDSQATPNPNNNPFCQRMIRATAPSGAQVVVKVVDRCPACGEGDLDLSGSAFGALTGQGTGKIDGVTWEFI